MPVRVFFSHAWKSKLDGAAVPELLTFLEDRIGADVWVDNERMTAGVDLDEHLEEEISKSDVVLLVLSRHVIGNDNVWSEVEAARRLGKPIIACRVDGVEVTGDRRLDRALHIDWAGPGVTRAVAERKFTDFFMTRRAAELRPEDQRTLDGIRKVSAALENLAYRRTRGADPEGDRAFAVRGLAKGAGLAEGDDSEDAEVLRGLEGVVQELAAAGNDPDRLRAVHARLQSMESEGGLGGMAAGKLRQEVEGRLHAGTRTARAPSPSPATPDSRPGPADPGAQVRALLGPHVPGHLLDRVATCVLDYVRAAPHVLNGFAAHLAATGHPELMQVAAALEAYLRKPNDLLPDHLGVLGVLDDAWLIHNTVAGCIAMGLTAAGDYAVDWNLITQANGVVEVLLPPQVKQALLATCGQFLAHARTASTQAWGGFEAGGGYEQSTEQLRDELGSSVGGLMLKYGV